MTVHDRTRLTDRLRCQIFTLDKLLDFKSYTLKGEVMFCRNCGKQLNDGDKFCPACGTSIASANNAEHTSENFPPVRENPTPAQNNNVQNALRPGDSASVGWAFLGFFIPIVGLILYLIWKQDYPVKAHSAGKGALVSVVVGVVCSIILTILISCITCAAFMSIPNYY